MMNSSNGMYITSNFKNNGKSNLKTKNKLKHAAEKFANACQKLSPSTDFLL